MAVVNMTQLNSESLVHKSALTEQSDNAREMWSLSLLYLSGGVGFVLWAKSGAGNWIGAAVVCVFIVLVGSMSLRLTYVERSQNKRADQQASDGSLIATDMVDVSSGQMTETGEICTDTNESIADEKAHLEQVAGELNNLEDQLLTEKDGKKNKANAVWIPPENQGG